MYGPPSLLHRFDDAEAVESGHLDVEKDDVGPRSLDRRDGLAPGACLADDLYSARCREQAANLRAGWRLVVSDQRAHAPGSRWRVHRGELAGGKANRDAKATVARDVVCSSAVGP